MNQAVSGTEGGSHDRIVGRVPLRVGAVHARDMHQPAAEQFERLCAGSQQRQQADSMRRRERARKAADERVASGNDERPFGPCRLRSHDVQRAGVDASIVRDGARCGGLHREQQPAAVDSRLPDARIRLRRHPGPIEKGGLIGRAEDRLDRQAECGGQLERDRHRRDEPPGLDRTDLGA
jgi:hypothetical protein